MISHELYFAVVHMNVRLLEFNFADFELYMVPMHCQNVRMVLISQKQFMQEIREINPTQNLWLLQ